MEKAGTGIKRIKDASLENKNLVEFRDRGTYFFAVFENMESPDVSDETVEKIINVIKENPKVTVNELVARTGLSRRGVEWNILKLKEKGLLKRIGLDK